VICADRINDAKRETFGVEGQRARRHVEDCPRLSKGGDLVEQVRR
jgi:hypothetical protein